MKILREEQENSQAPVPSTSAGARGLAVTAEMSNQDIKVSIAPSDTQSSGSESDLDSAKWSIACRKTTALDIVTIMAGNTDAAVALVENLIAKKYMFKMDHGPEITCGKDWLRINIPKNAKVRKGKGKGRSDKKSQKGKGDSKSLPKSPPRSPPKSPPKAPGSSQKYRGKPPRKERRDLCARKTPKQSKGADDKMSKQTNKKLEEEDDECSAPVQAAIINSCQEANLEEADAIQAAIQATYREAEESKREAEAEDVNTLVWLADHDDMIDVLEDSEDEPPTPKTNTNRMGAPPDLADYENNNKQQIAESMEVKMAHAAIEEAERPGQLDLEQPEEENRRTEFFPNPQSKNAKLANEDDPSRQLNVHGLTPEFPMATAGGKAEKELPSIHCRLVRFGLLMGPGKIIGARPASRSIKNDQDATMRVTYDSHNTKKIVVKAANSAGLWVYREKNDSPLLQGCHRHGKKSLS